MSSAGVTIQEADHHQRVLVISDARSKRKYEVDEREQTENQYLKNYMLFRARKENALTETNRIGVKLHDDHIQPVGVQECQDNTTMWFQQAKLGRGYARLRINVHIIVFTARPVLVLGYPQSLIKAGRRVLHPILMWREPAGFG